MDKHGRIETALIHGGIDGDERTGAVSVPIYQTSTYRQDSLGHHRGYEYSRTKNPTRDALESLIAQLECGKHGLAFASGMAAITAVLMLLETGDRVILSNNVYGGTFRVLDRVFKPFGLEVEIVDTSNLDILESRMDPAVKAMIIESPSNPLLSITDIAGASAIARRHGVLSIVDNTFMTPYLQRPLELGADIVVHSATKYLGGHSDLVAGLVVVDDPEIAERLYYIQNATGAILQPFDSWLLIRGIKTLGVRMDRHVENARHVVEYLNCHPAVERLYFPGLAGSAGFDIHCRQASAPGAMISFVLSDAYDLQMFFRSINLIALGESLGGVESLISHPASMTHASIPLEIRRKVGIVDNLIRLSVGLEHWTDIAEDLGNAFERSL